MPTNRLRTALFSTLLVAVCGCRGSSTPSARTTPAMTAATSGPPAPGASASAPAVSSGPDDSPEITSETGNGLHDLVFRATPAAGAPAGTQRLTLTGWHRGTRVALGVDLLPQWTQGHLSGDAVAYSGRVRFRSVDALSDAFITTLAAVYSSKAPVRRMKPSIDFTATSLEGDPRDVAKHATKIKLFFEPGDEQDYAELYLNIDLAHHRAELREKDPDYRDPILRALGESR